MLEGSQEIICTLQLLHVLESNNLPLCFNNGLVVFKGVSSNQFLLAEGWVGHDGHLICSALPNQLCVEVELDRILGYEEHRRAVNRLSAGMADTFQRLVDEAQHWDHWGVGTYSRVEGRLELQGR